MTVPTKSLKELFLAAVEVAPEDRPDWLQRECGADSELRERVGRMLAAHDIPHSLLDRPGIIDSGLYTVGASATADSTFPVRPGTQIGPYKLLQQIGEGGMGVVYMAEQQQPVKRRVALKIIKPGMDSRQVIARFEAERQALSLMDHPNIAKVLDAGTTENGRPFFVMELVKGQPITQYCDEHHLTPRQRLELLLPVCQAVQHAHQKGIIHRDIKPTNILVAEYDQQPVPKIIDFGVAKAISQSLTEKTMFTGLGQIVGTLEYMSPEQAKVNQLDIDTRSDIYSLGVLMYELLTGSTPFDKERLRSAGWDEMLRIIREEEPAKPSTKLSSSDSLPSVAASRSMEPARLSRTLRGELDWIVMKALEKDRNRRYESANGLAMDIQRYLHDEPTTACPPSAAYRFSKFARRNRTSLLISLAALAVIVAISIGSSIAAVAFRSLALRNQTLVHQKDEALIQVTAAEASARNAQAVERSLRQDAEQARNSAVLESRRANLTVEMIVKMLAMGNPNDSKGRATDYTVQEMLLDLGSSLPKELDGQPAVKAEIHAILARALTHLENDRADHHVQESLRLRLELYGDTHPKVAESLLLHAMHMRTSGLDSAIAEKQSRQAIEILRLHPEETELMLEAYGQLCKALVAQKKDREIRPAVAEAIDYAQRNQINNHRRLATMLQQDATACLNLGQTSEAESLISRSIAMQRKLPGMTLLDDGYMAEAYGFFMSRLKRPADAEKHHRDAIAIFRQYPRWWTSVSNSLVALHGILGQGRQAEFQQLTLDLANQGGIRALAWVATNKAARGDEEGYRNDCQQLVALCSNSANHDALEAVTYVCAWRRNALQDWGQVALLAQRLADVSPQSSQIQTTLGAILYRSGKTEDCLKALNQAVAIDSTRQDKKLRYRLDDIRRSLFLALAHQKVGNSLDARRWLVHASSQLAEARRRTEAGEASVFGRDQHLIHLFRLREEATELVARGADDLASLHNEIQAVGSRTGAEADRPEMTELLANDLIQLGDLLTERKEFAQAAEAYQRALVCIERLSRQFPEKPDYRVRIAQALQVLGRKINKQSESDLAETAFRQAIAIFEQLASDFPGGRVVGEGLGHTYRLLANRLDPKTKASEREQLFRQAAAQFKELLDGGATSARAADRRFILADSYRSLADVLSAQMKTAEAEAAYRQALDQFALLAPEILTNPVPELAWRREALRLGYGNLMSLLNAAGRSQEAAQVCQRAVELYAKFAAEREDEPYFREQLENHRAKLAQLQAKQSPAENPEIPP